jgi:Galactose oxidase, central domain/Kelch motif
MTATFDFDRLLMSVLEDGGPAAVSSSTVEAALRLAQDVPQRRPLVRMLDRRAWPAPRFSPANPATGRLATAGLVLLLTLALVATAILVGSRLLKHEAALPGAWIQTAPMRTQRDPESTAASTALLTDGRVLFVGGVGKDAKPAPAELFDPSTNTFQTTAGQMTAVTDPVSATTLRGGRVLVVGGATAEVFDPATGTFSPTGPMDTPRFFHTATLLANGRVLVVGGDSFEEPRNAMALAEVYDPVAGTWSEVGAMSEPRQEHTATLLPDGRVLVAGGDNSISGAPLATAELFDPSTGTFSPAASMSVGRAAHTATLLADGQVLITSGVVEGDRSDRLTSAEVYDPKTDRFSTTGSLVTERYGHSAILLPDGRVLVAGGWNGFGRPLSAELYDPTTGTFRVAASAASELSGPAVRLSDGRVLIGGGQPEVFDPAGTTPLADLPERSDRTFVTTGAPMLDRSNQTATRLVDGRVLIVGGVSPDGPSDTSTSAEIYDPATGSFSATGSMSVERGGLSDPPMGHTAVLLADGRVLMVGGTRHSWLLEIYDPGTGRFSHAGSLAPEGLIIKHRISAVRLADGRIIVFGPPSDADAGSLAWASTALMEFDPVHLTTTRIGSTPGCAGVDAVVALADGRVLAMCAGGPHESLNLIDLATGRSSWVDASFAGGPAAMVPLLDGRVLIAKGIGKTGLSTYDPGTGQVTDVSTLIAPPSGATLTSLADGRVLIVGGPDAAVWDPATGISTKLPMPIATRNGHTATLLDDGRVLIVGGTQWPADRSAPHPAGAELFDPAALR